jgi:hypothetical protein
MRKHDGKGNEKVSAQELTMQHYIYNLLKNLFDFSIKYFSDASLLEISLFPIFSWKASCLIRM